MSDQMLSIAFQLASRELQWNEPPYTDIARDAAPWRQWHNDFVGSPGLPLHEPRFLYRLEDAFNEDEQIFPLGGSDPPLAEFVREAQEIHGVSDWGAPVAPIRPSDVRLDHAWSGSHWLGYATQWRGPRFCRSGGSERQEKEKEEGKAKEEQVRLLNSDYLPTWFTT